MDKVTKSDQLIQQQTRRIFDLEKILVGETTEKVSEAYIVQLQERHNAEIQRLREEYEKVCTKFHTVA